MVIGAYHSTAQLSSDQASFRDSDAPTRLRPSPSVCARMCARVCVLLPLIQQRKLVAKDQWCHQRYEHTPTAGWCRDVRTSLPIPPTVPRLVSQLSVKLLGFGVTGASHPNPTPLWSSSAHWYFPEFAATQYAIIYNRPLCRSLDTGIILLTVPAGLRADLFS